MRPIHTLLMLAALAVPATAQGHSDKLIDLSFQGGSLADLVAAVKKASDDGNIVASPMAADVPVPALSLKRATILTSLQAVARIVGSPYDARVDVEASGFGNEVYSVAVRKLPQAATQHGAQDDGDRVAVFSLSALTRPLPTDPKDYAVTLSATTVLTAVEAGLSVAENDPSATLKYHEESMLLFVRGSRQQLSVVDQTLDNLRDDLHDRRKAAVVAARDKERQSRPVEPGEPETRD